MERKETDDVELLLSRLDKDQLADFIRRECNDNRRLKDRFLALGNGIVFKPEPARYASRVHGLIEDYAEKRGYIDYQSSFGFNQAVTGILKEADEAMRKKQWVVAVAVLTGIASVAEDIMYSGDDSAGELGAIVDACFEKWHELCADESQPESIKDQIFEFALSRFNDKHLKGFDWWWDWMEMAIDLADTHEKQKRLLKALDAIKPDDDDISAKYNVETAKKYKLEIMSRCASPEEQVRYMYDNVSIPYFRRKLLQMVWDKSDYDEVLRLAEEGINHDAEYAGLVSDWHKWEYKVYREKGDRANELRLAEYFFFKGDVWGQDEYSMKPMYSTLRSLVPHDEWGKYVMALISEARGKNDINCLLYIYTQEKMWQEYMDYIRKNPSISNIEEAPEEVKKLFKDEIVGLYAAAVRTIFERASSRGSYREGVELLRTLIKYGGAEEAEQIIAEQKSRRPRRPALLDELSKL